MFPRFALFDPEMDFKGARAPNSPPLQRFWKDSIPGFTSGRWLPKHGPSKVKEVPWECFYLLLLTEHTSTPFSPTRVPNAPEKKGPSTSPQMVCSDFSPVLGLPQAVWPFFGQSRVSSFP